MEETYKPTKKEVLAEMFSGAKNVPKKMKDFVGSFLISTIALSTILYYVPSSFRLCTENKPDEILKRKELEKLGSNGGLISGGILTLGQVLTYGNLASEGNPEYLLIPATTNAISLGYEGLVRPWKKAKQRLVDKQNQLEKEVSE